MILSVMKVTRRGHLLLPPIHLTYLSFSQLQLNMFCLQVPLLQFYPLCLIIPVIPMFNAMVLTARQPCHLP